jgi:SAM-dependent methyltransferase
MPGAAELEARFRTYYSGSSGKVAEIFERNRDKVLRVLARLLRERKAGGRVLDVGCGSGYFLGGSFGLADWERWGSEISEETAALAEASGIRTVVGDFANAGFADSFFDAVCVLDTFYYFPAPQKTLREIHRILKPGGVLLLELPFAATRLWRVSSKANRMDLYYYSPRPIVRLLKEAGFTVEQIVPLPANKQRGLLRNLFYAVYSFATWAIWNLSFRRLVMAPRFAVAGVK